MSALVRPIMSAHPTWREILISDGNSKSRTGCSKRSHQPRRPSAYDKDVTVEIALLVLIRIWSAR